MLPEGGPPPAKRGKKSKNKFKTSQQDAAPEPVRAPPAPQPPSGVTKKQKKLRNKHHAQQAVDDVVAVQADAPGASQQQQQQHRRQQAAEAGGRGGVGQPPRGTAGRPLLAVPSGGKKSKGGSSLLQQMRQRLQGGRFRWLNEALYTSDGAEALRMVQREPDLMQQYHEGFREQTKGWPVQPVDQAIRWLRGRPASWSVADLGCGDAKIAAAAVQLVHSFDLASTAPGVVACNMADVPLGDGDVDAAVFCLSLMGTDYGSFLEEAARILKPAGWLWIAEVQSRFVGEDGRSVLPAFLEALGTLGFAPKRKDTTNSHFLVLELQRQPGKAAQRGRAPAWPPLRPCQYKKR